MYEGERVSICENERVCEGERECVRETCERDRVCSGRCVNERENVLGKRTYVRET